MNRIALGLSTLAATLLLGACANTATPAAPAQPAKPQAAAEVAIWPKEIGPGSEGMALKQQVVERSKDPAQVDRAVLGVTRPTLTVFKPAKPNGVAVLITPGGAYARTVIDKEGADVSVPFNAAGVTVFVLQYRLPAEGHFGSNGKDGKGRDVPLADVQRAIRSIRANAAQWGINPAKVGVLGFSAGGHVAASLATKHANAVYPATDAADKLSARPDFLMLMYPVITMDAAGTHKGSREALLGLTPTAQEVADYSLENKVSKDVPPTFIAFSADDTGVPPNTNGILFQQKLAAQKVPVEMHAFPDGGHGFGIRGVAGKQASAWPQLALNWMNSIGMK